MKRMVTIMKPIHLEEEVSDTIIRKMHMKVLEMERVFQISLNSFSPVGQAVLPGRGQNNSKGGDYETEMEITLEEAYSGTSRIIQVEKRKAKNNDKTRRLQ